MDDDGTVSPLDVLRLVNRINGVGNGEGENDSPMEMESRSLASPVGQRSDRTRTDAIDAVLAAASFQSLWEEIAKRREAKLGIRN